MAETELQGSLIDGRFRIISCLGSGGMGAVYLAEQSDLDRLVAIKLMHPDIEASEDDRKRFLQEAQLLSRLEDPGIVKVLCSGFLENGQSYIVMEYLEGNSLRSILNAEPAESESQKVSSKPKDAKIDWKQAVLWGANICSSMQSCHEKGIIHRDLKPENIILAAGTKTSPRVIDFGLGTFLERTRQLKTLTATGLLIGSAHYMSPEQAQGMRADQRSDIYALACIIYECIAGRPPFDADFPVGIIYKHANEKHQPLQKLLAAGSIDEELDLILNKALAKDVKERYQSMSEFEADLRALLSGNKEALRTKLKAYRTNEQKSHKFAIGATLVLALSTAVIVPFLFPMLIPFLQKQGAKAPGDEILAARPKQSHTRLTTRTMTSLQLLIRLDEYLVQGNRAAANELLANWQKSHEKGFKLSKKDQATVWLAKAKIQMASTDVWEACKGLAQALKLLKSDKSSSDQDLIPVLQTMINAEGWQGHTTGNIAEAEREIERILHDKNSNLTNAQKIPLIISLTEVKMGRKDYAEAVTLLKQCEDYSREFTINPLVYRQLSLCYFAMKQPKKAIQAAYQYAGILKPVDPDELLLHRDPEIEATKLNIAASCAASAMNWDLAVKMIQPALSAPGKDSQKEQIGLIASKAEWNLRRWAGPTRNSGPILDRSKSSKLWLKALAESESDYKKCAQYYAKAKDKRLERKALIDLYVCQFMLGNRAESERTLALALKAEPGEDQIEINSSIAALVWTNASICELCAWQPESFVILSKAKELFDTLETRDCDGLKKYCDGAYEGMKASRANSQSN